MRMIIDYAGESYETAPTDVQTAKESADAIYAAMDDINKLQLELAEGGFLLLGPEAIKSCAIRVLEN